ncbi:MAG: 50S ribosomal protein L30 [Gammaproteobacteria bacterium]|nr:50S ribosomal protein L30 [Gammaproteobacteria bacterium]
MTKNETSKKQMKVTQLKSVYGKLAAHKACVHGLGLRKIRQSAIVEDTACTRGMANKVSYMVKVEDV